MVTEFQLRAEFEEYVAKRKREAFLAGYRQRPGKGGGRVRANHDLRLRMVALHLAGGLSYSAICEAIEVDLSWAAVQEAVSRTAGELGLALPKCRGRKRVEVTSKYQ